MKKKNGFTLVELLAVIVILAIIMIIAIPAVLETMQSARKKTFKEYAMKMTSEGQKTYLADQLTMNPGNCTLYRIKTDLGLNNTEHARFLNDNLKKEADESADLFDDQLNEKIIRLLDEIEDIINGKFVYENGDTIEPFVDITEATEIGEMMSPTLKQQKLIITEIVFILIVNLKIELIIFLSKDYFL